MSQNPLIVFVCDHGAAKSVIAAAHFNLFARQMGMDVYAVARGTNPDSELSPQTVSGLANDGLTPTEMFPQKFTDADIQNSQRVIAFCDLPSEYPQPKLIEHWEDIPPVGEDYKKARDAIVERIHQMLNS